MDTSVLHSVTDDLAAYLSEAAPADLRHPIPTPTSRTAAELYLHLIRRDVEVTAALEVRPGAAPPDLTAARSALDANGPHDSLDRVYRIGARRLVAAFAATVDADASCLLDGRSILIADVYEEQIRDCLVHTWDLAQVLDLPFTPHPDTAWRILPTVRPTDPVDDTTVFECVLRLSGRRIGVSAQRS